MICTITTCIKLNTGAIAQVGGSCLLIFITLLEHTANAFILRELWECSPQVINLSVLCRSSRFTRELALCYAKPCLSLPSPSCTEQLKGKRRQLTAVIANFENCPFLLWKWSLILITHISKKISHTNLCYVLSQRLKAN